MSRISRALVLVGVCLLLVAGCSSAPGGQSGSTASGIGDLPTFLPSASANVVAHGSADSPAMSYAGSPVVVQLATGHVTVDVQGPAFPADTKLGADQVVCTFTITLRDSDTTVPLAAAQFDVLEPHRTVTFELAATLPSGEGLLRYHPAAGAVVAAWDYVAETD